MCWIPVGLHSLWFLSAEVLGDISVCCCPCSGCVSYLNIPRGVQGHRACSRPVGRAAGTLWQEWQAQLSPGAWSVKEYEKLEKLRMWGFTFLAAWLKSEVFSGWRQDGAVCGSYCQSVLYITVRVCWHIPKAVWDALPAFQGRRHNLWLHILKDFFQMLVNTQVYSASTDKRPLLGMGMRDWATSSNKHFDRKWACKQSFQRAFCSHSKTIH